MSPLKSHVMNNKLIEKSIAVSARPYMYILTVMLFLLSCGSDNNTPTEDLGNTTNHYLKLQPSGLNVIKVSCLEAPTRFELVIEVLQTFALPLGYGAMPYVLLSITNT